MDVDTSGLFFGCGLKDCLEALLGRNGDVSFWITSFS